MGIEAVSAGGRETPAGIEILEVEIPAAAAKQAIAVFDSGSGGLVTATYLTRMLRASGQDLGVIFLDRYVQPARRRAQMALPTSSCGVRA